MQAGKQPLPAHLTPLHLSKAVVRAANKMGALETIPLTTHKALLAASTALLSDTKSAQSRFQEALKTGNLVLAWSCASLIRSQGCWRQLGEAALQLLDVPIATAAYRQVSQGRRHLNLHPF